MSEQVVLKLIDQMPMILTALASVLSVVMAFFMRKQQNTLTTEVTTLKENVDGKMTKLLETTERAANLAGQVTGRADEKADTATAAAAEATKVELVPPNGKPFIVEVQKMNVDTLSVEKKKE